MRNTAVFLCTTFVVLLCTASAMAVPVTFFGEDLLSYPPRTALFPTNTNALAARNDFLSHLTGAGNEDFESFASGQPTPLALTFSGSSGDIDADLTSGANGFVFDGTSLAAARQPTSGSKWFNWDPGGNTVSIEFSTAISAFGFYGTDIGDVGGDLTLELEMLGGGTVNLAVGNSTGFSSDPDDGYLTDGALLFYGFHDLDVAYTKITFGNTSYADGFGFDDMIIADRGQINASPITEPATMLLLGSGLIGLVGFRRRSKRS